MTAPDRSLRFGVNYTPTRDWMFQWMTVEPDAVRTDFEAIAALGVDHVRVFPLWPVLQPNRTLIRQRALDDIALVAAIAAEFDLDIAVDVIQGHMSGFDFVPAWLVNWHGGNMFTDPVAIEAQADLVRAVHRRLLDQPNYFALTLGNEVNQFQPPNPAAMPADSGQVEHWLRTLLGAAEPAGGRVVTHSENDHLWYRDQHPFLPVHAARLGDVSTVHSWIFNGTGRIYGGLSEESVRHGEWMIELAGAFADDPGRRVWLQEVGAPSWNLAPHEEGEFCRRTLAAALTSPALYGVTWWCSHDIDPALGDFKDLEYSLGLIDHHNRIKPLGEEFRDRIADARREQSAPIPRTAAVVVDVDADERPISRSSLGPGGAVFEAWHAARAAGRPVGVVTSRTASDPDALAARGITELIRRGPRTEANA